MTGSADDRYTRQLDDRTLVGGDGEVFVRVLNGELKGREIPLPERQPVILGSSFEATLQLRDSAVSRLHLELINEKGHVRARDMGSTNGSFFEGNRFSVLELLPGSIVRLGETEVQIVAAEANDPLPPSEATSFGGLIGRSRKIRDVFAVLERAARSDSTVLVTGETGTGKEVVAESIHKASTRAEKPFIVVDCASIPANLIESELFGHVKGAYTHAVSDREGAFLAADGGTIFLDEIGELPSEMQPRLLRVLETKTLKPVGGNKYQPVDVRVVAATNRNLETEVAAGHFRSDLYYRLAVLRVALPALRERREDIVLLARHFAQGFGERGSTLRFTPEVTAALLSYDWPGNVRELRNVIHQAVSLSSEGLSLALRLSERAGSESGVAKMVNEVGAMGSEVFYELPFKEARKRAIEAFELGYVNYVIEKCDGNVTKAAEKAGLHRNMLHRILARGKEE